MEPQALPGQVICVTFIWQAVVSNAFFPFRQNLWEHFLPLIWVMSHRISKDLAVNSPEMNVIYIHPPVRLTKANASHRDREKTNLIAVGLLRHVYLSQLIRYSRNPMGARSPVTYGLFTNSSTCRKRRACTSIRKQRKERRYVSLKSPLVRMTKPQRVVLFQVHGCSPAMGYSFAAGTTDGPGAFDFKQGTKTDNPLWNAVRNFLAPPTEEDIECQAPKPILIASGRVKVPYAWQPTIVPTQLIQIGDVIIAALPGEFTTMSGRRVQNAVKNAVLQAGAHDVHVILAGLSNIYTSYVTTPEEYQVQRYEGASTIFGPHTLTLYVEQFEKLAYAMVHNESMEPGPAPPSLDDKVISFTPPVFYDTSPFGKRFGDVTQQPAKQYKRGTRANVQFISGNPRNDIQHDKTYFTIELQNSADGSWSIIATDSNWETS